MKSLNEMNTTPCTSEWNGLRLQQEIAVGSRGRRGSGAKVHLLRTTRVVAILDNQPHRLGIGDIESVTAICNGNGVITGRIIRGLDTDAVTCKTCLAMLGEECPR